MTRSSIRHTLAGKRAAFAALVDRYRDAVCGLAFHHLGSFEDAQDAAQEAFVHAYLHLEQLRDPGRFAPWLRRITANVCADFLRRRGQALVSLDALEEAALPPLDPAPQEDLERLATRIAVREALGHLSEKIRLTVTLCYVSGYSHAEVARFLDLPVNTVRSRLQHARKQLREEMLTMVTDVLNEGRPDPQFTRRVIEEAMRRGEAAVKAHAAADALRCYEEALAAIEKLPPDAEQQRLKMEALWQKGEAAYYPRGREAAVHLYEESLALAEKLGDRTSQAWRLMRLGIASVLERGQAEEYYQKALQLFQELGDARGQAECLLWLGTQFMFAREIPAGKEYYEQASSRFEAAGVQDWTAVCRAMLDLLAEIGEKRFPELIVWSALCEVLEKRDGAVSLAGQPGTVVTDRRPEVPAGLYISSVFWQLSRLEPFLDPFLPVGGSQSRDSFSYSYQPLQTTVTVQSASECVTVPAGTFADCLLIEMVTTASDHPDEAAEQQKEMNRRFLCGTRRAWFAPGVGLAQLDVRIGDGEACLQLQEFSVPAPSRDYLPLAIGNRWVYGWADVPPGYRAKEVYSVTAQAQERRYLEHYHHLSREGAAS